MFKSKCVVLAVVLLCGIPWAAAESGSREFAVGSGAKLVLDLRAGGSVDVRGTGGSSILVDYDLDCAGGCEIGFDERGGELEIRTDFASKDMQRSDIDLTISVPRYTDVEIDSMGGGLTIDGVEGKFEGKTMGGQLVLHDVRGEAQLQTMGGKIRLTDSELDGSLKTMGGEVLFENVIGDVKGSSMGGNVRYKNVQRRDGRLGAPPRTGDALDEEITPETVTISTMGGGIEVEDAPEGADVHTMGGDVEIRRAERFVRAKTMGGDIRIDSVDGWVQAVTMSGDVDVQVTGRGGDVTLTSMSGDVTLYVPAGFGMELDLEIAYTRNSRKAYTIETPGSTTPTTTDDWDYEHGSPRKYIRSHGSTGGGGHEVKIRTVNGNIKISER